MKTRVQRRKKETKSLDDVSKNVLMDKKETRKQEDVWKQRRTYSDEFLTNQSQTRRNFVEMFSLVLLEFGFYK